MPNTLVLYHGACTDGFTAAWAAWCLYKDQAQYMEAIHGDPPPDVTGKDVLLLDFAYPLDIMLQLKAKAASVRVIDHHKTAVENLGEMEGCVFDLSRSGAGLAWDILHEGAPRPLLINLVEDFDLSRFNDDRTLPAIARLELESYDFVNWSRIAKLIEDEAQMETWLEDGRLMLAQKLVFYGHGFANRYEVTLKGVKGFAANAPAWAASGLGIDLAKASGTFGLVWHRTGRELKCSLRSVGDFDVSNLARLFGGGGHQNSSAFTMPADVMGLGIVNGSFDLAP